jgi:hypothetical protein
MEINLWVGIGALLIEGIVLYVSIMNRVDARFAQYVRKGEQDIVNRTLERDIADIKNSIKYISGKIESLLCDVPGIMARVIREELRR